MADMKAINEGLIGAIY